MNKKLIVGNWKMNPRDIKEAQNIFDHARKEALNKKNITTVICPPTVYLFPLSLRAGKSSRFFLGAQDVFYEHSGAYTGEISPFMLSSAGAKYIIVGHSERRALGDSDEIVAKKLLLSLKMGFYSILCIGEKERDDSGNYFHFIKNQIHTAIASRKKIEKQLLSHLVIAYEPIWAIGVNATQAIYPKDLLEMTIFIQKTLTDMYDAKTAKNIPILYGGSVDEKNAGNFLGPEGGAQGLLIGRASIDARKFGTILTIAESA